MTFKMSMGKTWGNMGELVLEPGRLSLRYRRNRGHRVTGHAIEGTQGTGSHNRSDWNRRLQLQAGQVELR